MGSFLNIKLPKPKPETIRIASLGIIAFLVLVFVSANFYQYVLDYFTPVEASVTQVQGGKLYHKPARSKKLVSINKGSRLASDTYLITKAGTFAEIELGDRTILRLDEKSEIKINALSSTQIRVNLSKGRVIVRQVADSSFVLTVDDLEVFANDNIGEYLTSKSKTQTSVSSLYSDTEIMVRSLDMRKILEGQEIIFDNTTETVEVQNISLADLSDFLLWNKESDKAADNPLGILDDSNMLKIYNLSHPDGSLAASEIIDFTGKLTFYSPVEIVINQEAVKVDAKGLFAKRIKLAEGQNTVSLQLSDEIGNKLSKTYTITYKKLENKLVLSAEEIQVDQILLSWELPASLNTGSGFKILKGDKQDLKYPADSHKYIAGRDARSFVIQASDSETDVFVKICVYDTNTDLCGIYSNVVKINLN